MKTVLVFKTSVVKEHEVKMLRPMLNQLTEKNGKWNFDLEDCDNILRVETRNLRGTTVTAAMQGQGFYCEELAD